MKKRELIKNGGDGTSSSKKDKSTKRLLVIFLVFFLFIGIYFFVFQAKEKSDKKNHTSAEQTFVLKTIKGQTFKIIASPKNFKIPKLQNRIIFLKVFGWNCKYCQKEIPELIKLKNQFDGAFDVIAIESQHHTTQENIELAKEKGINYHIVTGDKYEDFLNYLKEHHGWSGVIPLSIVIGEDGKILAFEIGAKSYTLAELLKVSLQQYKMLKKLQNKE
ncbi:MAG: TlpA family protein disulfide reductase [Epsilonproteobacteria bacterium]|nr:TlpA family protein disulfide reductase [Campylobacterota bacterium]